MDTNTRRAGEDEALGLSAVLVGSLPATLLTDAAPERYTVEAIFTRRPDPEEVAEIVDDRTRAYLAEAGCRPVELTVSDRRLEIADTNLEELRDGLASVIVQRLSDISAGVRSRRDADAVVFQEAADHEQERAAAVAALADSVRFDAPVGDRLSTGEDRARVAAWHDEGGRGR